MVVLMTHSVQTSPDLPARMTIKQSAQFLAVDEKTIRRWISSGRIKAYRLGSKIIRVDRDSLLKVERPIGGGTW